MSDKAKTRRKLNVNAIVILSLMCVLAITICIFADKIIDAVHPTEKETINYSEVADNVSQAVDDVIIGSEGTISTVAAAPTLDDLISISNLQSLTYNYNSICTVYDDDGEIAYYVSYRGTVVLGIDMDSILWDYDDTAKTITFSLPDVVCQSCSVEATSLRYIFVDESYDNGSTGATAQRECQADLEEKISDPDLCYTMFQLARENCKTGIIGMFQPLINQFFPDYTLDVVFQSEVGGE